MNWNNKTFRLQLLLAIPVLLLAFSRMLPHPPNVTPISAAALMAGTYFINPVSGLVVTLGAMLISDAVIGFHPTVPFVYLALALMIPLGRRLAGKVNPGSVLGTAFAGTVLFFIVSNLGVWLMYDFYPMTGAGLLACFAAAIPFFGYSAVGDLFFAALLFTAMETAALKIPALSAISQRTR